MDLKIPKLELPENPTNADLAKALTASLAATVGVHDCLENHVRLTRERDVVLSGQIKGINDQLNPEIATSAIAKINAKLEDLSPVAKWFKTFQAQRKWFLGALGTVIIALASSAATGLYTALTTQHVAVTQQENAQTVVQTAADLAAKPQYSYDQAKANWEGQRAINAQILAELKALNAKSRRK